MDKYLMDELKIERPIAFLCGPYYNKNNPGDKRNVLLQFLKTEYNDRVIALIIDDFLTAENIRDDRIKIQLLEEFFAAISSCTYIFLDTMSAASELGLFANHSTKNIIHVFLPYESDILKNNVGVFVKEYVIDQNKDKIELDYYRPKTIKKVIATNYIVEHYEFANNTIPREISTKLLNEKALSIKSSSVIVKDSPSIPDEIGHIYYTEKNKTISTRVSIKTLFYIVASITYSLFTRDQLKDKKTIKDSESIIQKIIKNIHSIILRTVDVNCFGCCFSGYDVEVKTIINMELYQIVKHMQKFICVYHENDHRNTYNFLTKSNDSFLKSISKDGYNNGSEVFNFSKPDYLLIQDIEKNKECYYESFIIRKYRKERKLYKYIDSEKGETARNFHKVLGKTLLEYFKHSAHSYAYQKGKSAVQCVETHENSVGFLKFDVHRFFNSINIGVLSNEVLDILKLDTVYYDQVIRVLDVCTLEDSLQLGLNISPLLSEVYMKRFDAAIGNFSLQNNLIYTRYADDILISSNRPLNSEIIDIVKSQVIKELKKNHLKLNSKKFYAGSFIAEGDHIKYLGVNIVHKKNGNQLTVGKSYKNAVAKKYLRFLSLPKDDPKYEKQRFYEAKRIAGQISYVKQVEGMDGYWKIIERIRKSTEGRVDIKTDKIYF